MSEPYRVSYPISTGCYSRTPYLSDDILRPLINVILGMGPARYVVRSAPCSCPVVTSALREPLSKHLSETIDPRTIVRTLGPLEEDNETSMQTSPVGLLDAMMHFAHRSACPRPQRGVSPWIIYTLTLG